MWGRWKQSFRLKKRKEKKITTRWTVGIVAEKITGGHRDQWAEV